MDSAEKIGSDRFACPGSMITVQYPGLAPETYRIAFDFEESNPTNGIISQYSNLAQAAMKSRPGGTIQVGDLLVTYINLELPQPVEP